MPTLNWIGKDKVTHHHLEVPFRTLVPQAPYGDTTAAGENLIIHGDNLEALKALLPQYEGQVNAVYIDPPYNTGNEGWVYNDNVNDPKIKKWLGEVVGKEGEDLSRHDKWLCMMYPRLKLLHRLLRDDGVFLCSIDENELFVLKLLLDEVFGSSRFLGSICWKTRNTDNRVVSRLSTDHEYILVYSRGTSLYGRKIDRSDFKNPENDSRGKYVTDPLTGKATAKDRPNLHYVVTNPHTGDRFDPDPSRGWITDQPGFLELIAQNRVYWPEDPRTGKPRKKRFLSETSERMPLSSFWADTKGQTGADELDKIMGARVFAFPKESDFISRVLDIAAGPNSLILDSFAGSGTTAHAVLKLNKADGGNRRFILIEREDYANTITAERVRRVIDGYGPEDKKVPGLGGGFTYATLGPPIFAADGALNPEVDLTALRQYIWYAETKTPMPTTTGEHPDFLGSCRGVSYYFAYRPNEETLLDFAYLKTITRLDDQFVIYADSCAVEAAFLKAKGIQFKKIPRDVPRY